MRGVVDQDVQPLPLGVDLLDHRPGGGIVGVVALDANARAACGIDGGYGFIKGAGQHFAFEGRGGLLLGPSGDVNHHAPARKPERDALASATGGARDQCDRCRHVPP